jgi:hypothetical protein
VEFLKMINRYPKTIPGWGLIWVTLTVLILPITMKISYASAQKFSGKLIVGYYPYWEADVDRISYSDLTNIVYFALQTSQTGDLIDSDIDYFELNELVRKAHSDGVDVSISLGGWLSDNTFSPMAANPDSRANFIQQLVEFCLDNNLDGVDLDWEPVRTESDVENYSLLIKELREALNPHGKLLSISVLAGHHDIRPWAAEYLDWVAVMAYELGYPHSTFEDSKQYLNFWADYGIPRDMLLLGVPFFGKNSNNEWVSYEWIVDHFDPDPDQNWVGDFFFNGRNLIQDKTRYVYDNDFGGMMIWQLSQDKFDNRSLLTALTSAAREYEGSDTESPAPDPIFWASPPYVTGEQSVAMIAASANDLNGVEYYFACVSGQQECTDSGWQSIPSYEDTGLAPGTTYSYQVVARDKSVNQNETAWSPIASATTNESAVCVAKTLHIESIWVSTENRRRGYRAGKVTVVLEDNCGGLVQDAEVSGRFSGDFNELFNGTSDTEGRALFVTQAQVRRPSYNFCVEAINHPLMVHDVLKDLETCNGI